MENSLRIKISIADRVYPLTINYDQEEAIRKAAKKIDAIIKEFEENYAVRDKQDLLAMCALELASRDEQTVIDHQEDLKNTLQILSKIQQDLDANL